MDVALIKQVNAARVNREAICVVRDLGNGEARVVTSQQVASEELSDELEVRLKSGKSGVVEIDGRETFIQVHVPPPRLVIIGAVHITQALAPMAMACDFDVSVIDPRTAFATKERFPDVALHSEWPADVLQQHPLDAFTAVAAVTHDPKIDDIPLQMALEAGCFYVGALGSRKTHGKRLGRLQEVGVSESMFERIHAPIGLDIGAANPAEIAVSVMAEIIERLRRGDAK